MVKIEDVTLYFYEIFLFSYNITVFLLLCKDFALLDACTPSTRHKKLAEGNCKGGIIHNEVADFPQLYSFCNVLPNSVARLAPELEGLSMKKQHLLFQQSHRQRQQMCPKSKTSNKVCKIGNIHLNRLSKSFDNYKKAELSINVIIRYE